MSIALTPYDPAYDSAITELENSIVQGRGIQLKIQKNHFLDRSNVFLKTFPCLAVTEEQQVIGTAVGAATTMAVNGRSFTAGFALDVKVHSDFRNSGIGRQLAKQQKEWFRQQGWEKNFITLKLSNAPVIKLTAKAIGKFWLRPFVYLTIPTCTSIPTLRHSPGPAKFSVRLFEKEQLPSAYYTSFNNGLGVFHTWMLYRLKIDKLSLPYRLGLNCMKRFFPKRYALLPAQNDVMEPVTLYNHNDENIHGINEVLQHLRAGGKKFLLVCCSKGDSIYRQLKKYSINTYDYYVLTDFPLSSNDELSIDVRCL